MLAQVGGEAGEAFVLQGRAGGGVEFQECGADGEVELGPVRAQEAGGVGAQVLDDVGAVGRGHGTIPWLLRQRYAAGVNERLQHRAVGATPAQHVDR